jgi:hypothetical protein
MTFKIEINGKWKYIKPISGPYKKTEKIKTKTIIKTEIIKSSLFEKENGYNIDAGVKTSLSIVDIDVSSKFNSSEKSKIEENIKNEKSMEYENEIELEINLEKEDTRYIYKLIYENKNMGFYYEADATQIIKSERKELEEKNVDPIMIIISTKKIKLLKDIKVVYTDDLIDRPDDIIEEVDGKIKCADINYKHSGKYVWLVPEHTYIVNEAVTDIKIRFEKKGDDNNYDLAKGDGNSIFRYLKIIHDKNNNKKILFDKIKLYNTDNEKSLPNSKDYGYEKYTKDINEGRDGNGDSSLAKEFPLRGFYPLPIDVKTQIKKHYYLYLCWDTITL